MKAHALGGYVVCCSCGGHALVPTAEDGGLWAIFHRGPPAPSGGSINTTDAHEGAP
jgi:hypothetical protein